MMYRQGDVLITSVPSLPRGAKRIAPGVGRFVLAEGEATGHAHAVLERAPSFTVEAFERDGVTYLRTTGEAEVTHQEHDSIQLPSGIYRVGRQREYSPEEIRNVAD